MIPVKHIERGIGEIAGRPFHPIELARVNNQVVRMALFRGSYHWHSHANEDELFYVIRGKITIQMKLPHSDVVLRAGELAVVPKGFEHCPKAEDDAYVLMFEPAELKSKGD